MKTKKVYTLDEKISYYRRQVMFHQEKLNFAARRLEALEREQIEIWKKEFREEVRKDLKRGKKGA